MTDATTDSWATPPTPPTEPERHLSQLEEALFEVKRVVVGQDRAIERLFTCLLSAAHCLLESAPGMARSLTLRTFTAVVGSDVVKARSLDEGPPDAAGDDMVVLATQSPVEGEDPVRLPLAERDRFGMRILLRYPTPGEEVEIVQRSSAGAPPARQVLSHGDVIRLREAAKEVYLDRGVIEYAVSLAQATRDPATYGMVDLAGIVSCGASPRATLGLVDAGKALAALRGRAYALPQDVFDVAPEVLRHRLVLSSRALVQGLDVEQVLARLLSTVAAPRIAPSQHIAES